MRTHPLPPPDLDCVMQDVKLQLLNLQWFQVLGASFSRFWGLRFRSRVLHFRDLGVFVLDLGCFVFEIWVLRASVFVFQCFVFETTFPLTRVWLCTLTQVNFNHVNKIEARYKLLR